MADHILKGSPSIPLTVRKSRRARRISLRISQLDGRVTLTLPDGLPESEALSFAMSKEDWIRKHLGQMPARQTVHHGMHLPVEGQMRTLVEGSGRRVLLSNTELAVPGSKDVLGPRLAGFLKQLARDRLAAASDRYASALGRPYSRITLRDTRSRWGSCTSQGNLMFSWRLILAPPDVLQYVAAHEVAHLAEMNHSPAFWRAVETLFGPYDVQRRWLRQEGASLHRYRFAD
ncbi:M48 family metallopeptidase [Thalassococcus sp. S3]|uniref:M48 family metallopeptidase n=1 Tax=Thalassococcus sp. S3 TaxID=2017482 RepID=UPI0010246E00|nr:SprT family zinc-dependent metalloprotease [Thalassococcus sp. S3]QBF30480.1 zinc metalloprotease [Thalassococcus sp. S3]